MDYDPVMVGIFAACFVALLSVIACVVEDIRKFGF